MFAEELERQLLAGSKFLLAGNGDNRLRDLLLSEFSDLEYAFVIDANIDQEEVFYTVLVPPETVLEIEMNRVHVSAEPIVSKCAFKEFLKTRGQRAFPKDIRQNMAVIRKYMR